MTQSSWQHTVFGIVDWSAHSRLSYQTRRVETGKSYRQSYIFLIFCDSELCRLCRRVHCPDGACRYRLDFVQCINVMYRYSVRVIAKTTTTIPSKTKGYWPIYNISNISFRPQSNPTPNTPSTSASTSPANASSVSSEAVSVDKLIQDVLNDINIHDVNALASLSGSTVATFDASFYHPYNRQIPSLPSKKKDWAILGNNNNIKNRMSYPGRLTDNHGSVSRCSVHHRCINTWLVGLFENSFTCIPLLSFF